VTQPRNVDATTQESTAGVIRKLTELMMGFKSGTEPIERCKSMIRKYYTCLKRQGVVPLCFISETANLFLPGFSSSCIFPGYNIHEITISALNMTGSCNAYTVDDNNNHSSLLSLWNLKIMKDTLRLLSLRCDNRLPIWEQ
jgi:hypothetical protein